jgi:Tol biopolymer transport system component
MLRWFLRITVGLTLIFGLLMAASAVIGRGTNPEVMRLLIAPQSSVNSPNHIRLVDLSRLLIADHAVPLENIQQMALTYYVEHQATVSTYYANSYTKEYTAGLYLYDYSTGSLTNIFTADADEPFNQVRSSFFSFFPAASHQGDRLAFIHPMDQQLTVIDIDTRQTTTLSNTELFQQPTGPEMLTWSPDDTQIAAKIGKTLYAVNADGSNQREYPFDSNNFYPSWSADGRYLWIQRYQGTTQPKNQPIEILDASDGSRHPFTQDLEGIDAYWWGCEDRWLTYTVVNGNQRDGYILDLNTGDKVRVNDHPLLAEESVEFISPLTNCQQFVVSGYIPDRAALSNAASSGVMPPTYLFDITTRSVEFLDNASGVLQSEEENEIYYQKRDDTTIQIFKRTINPLSEPVLVREFPVVKSVWVSWSMDFSFFIYLNPVSSNLYGGTLNIFDGQTGRTYTLTSPDELVQTFTHYKWRETQETS